MFCSFSMAWRLSEALLWQKDFLKLFYGMTTFQVLQWKKPSEAVLWKVDILQLFYGKKTFCSFSMAWRPSEVLLWHDDLLSSSIAWRPLKLFYAMTIFSISIMKTKNPSRSSFMENRTTAALLWKENFPSLFYSMKTFLCTSMQGRSSEALLWTIDLLKTV